MTRDNWTAFSGRLSDKLDIFTAAMRILILPLAYLHLYMLVIMITYTVMIFSHNAHLPRSRKLGIGMMNMLLDDYYLSWQYI